MIEQVISTTGKLVEIYKEKDNARKDEIAALGGQSATSANVNVFSAFYDRLKEIQEYHRRHPAARYVDTNDEYEQLLKEEPVIEFTGEDVMILDNSVLFGMADIHDRHRDMQLDVDSMSYEELLALEVHNRNVCTELSKETIPNHLKQHKYMDSKSDQETESCCICREEYNGGDGIGTLACGHNFHGDCIKEWLLLKKLCSICKTMGLIL